MSGDTWVIATNNKKKYNEISACFKSLGLKCISPQELGISSNPKEIGSTFRENAYIKAKALYDLCHLPVVADDSGLEVDFLQGDPVVDSAYYAGYDATDDQNIDKLLRMMGDVPKNMRGASFLCVICAITGDGQTLFTTGTWRGRIGPFRRGEGGFGYDPVFWLRGNHSAAQLSQDKKIQVSHRGRAIRKMAFRLRFIGGVRVKLKGNRI